MSVHASLTDAAADFCQSQHFMLLKTEIKQNAESLLAHWAQTAGGDPTALTVRDAMHGVARLNVPLSQRLQFPHLLTAFLEYLLSTGQFPHADSWLTVVEGTRSAYEAGFREDGSVRGTTVRKPVAGVGRNAPCPCGSGRKFKKCCGKG
ncbi:MAG: SEC-C metal-binding domain-containing protein [Candidatus Latescibacterota bacterium]|jgi:hypothetical protein|nr:SEC-C metal-binding domain-containing protein [Candidatus Latescibacterota bacterium]MED5416839.1 SEC-C metal-binding domain-containing protein [Candidatus Latescibacterota bacterium]